MVIVMANKKHNVYDKPNYKQIGQHRRIWTGSYWLDVSEQRDKKGGIIDKDTIVDVVTLNDFISCIMHGVPKTLVSISDHKLIKFDGADKISVGLDESRRIIPYDIAEQKGSVRTIRIRTDQVTNLSDSYGQFRQLYRAGSNKTPAVNIYWIVRV